MMRITVEHRTSKGWEVCHETDASPADPRYGHILEGAFACVKDVIGDGYQARLTVEPTITPTDGCVDQPNTYCPHCRLVHTP